MSAMYRSPSLENKALMSLYGDDGDLYFIRDEDCTSEEYELDSESSEEGKGGRGVRSSVSLEIYGLQREQQVHFSNLEYYRRLEELKDTHLRNMAELERMYINQGREWRGEEEEDGGGLTTGRNREDRQSISSCPTRTLQRINSQEELDFHETSSGSDQSEDGIRELELDTQRRRSPGQERTFGRDVLVIPEEMMNQKQFRFQPKASCPQPRGRLTHRSGVRARANSKVTVPKPFQMMLREEDRKRHKVRTRSEIELENTLLRRELEEIRECQKQFRASPAPAHIHLPLFEMISRRFTQRSIPRRSSSNNVRRDSKINRASAAVSPQPFNFLERERRKREAKIVAELGNLGQREECQGFKARPMPTSVYGARHRTGSKTSTSQPPSPPTCSLQRDSDLEPEVLRSKSVSSTDSREPQRCPTAKSAKKQLQVSIEMVKEGEWSYGDPFKAAA